VASGALTAVVSAEVERLRAQHAEAVREKSAADSKCRKLAEKVAVLEGERTELRRQLAKERREANQALAKAQSAQAEANVARVEGSLARQRDEEWEERFNALQARVERAEASTRSEAERTLSHPALRNKARCISYMRQEDNIYNNRVYRDKCHKTSEYLLHSGRLITK
jgi:chromosome segregation ATPase